MSDRDFLRACALVVLAFIIVVILGGCGGSSEPLDPPATIQPVICTSNVCG